MNALDDCCWPVLPQPYAGALRAAVAYILGRFDVYGVVACGSIIRGNPNQNSDFDIHAVHVQPQRQRIQKFFQGVPAEIFVNPPHAIRGYFADERSKGRPCTAHMLATGHVVWERDPIVAQLRREAQEWLAQRPDLSEAQLTWLRYAAADMYENAIDLAASDSVNATFTLMDAIRQMVHYRFLAANENLPREKEIVATLLTAAPRLGALIRDFYLAGDVAMRFRLATQIAEHTINATGFFEWESALEDVSVK